MSLKAFHIFFILLSIATGLGFGIWGILDYRTSGKAIHLWLGVTSLVITPALAYYLIKFLAKLRALKKS
jgi:hypothetical protein